MLSAWTLLAVVYAIVLAAVILAVLRPFGGAASLRAPVYWLGCTALAALAYEIGWTNSDLRIFALWGYKAATGGPASTYGPPYPSEYPPLYPMLTSVPVALDLLLGAHGTKLETFLVRLVPLCSLFALPFLMRAALLATGVEIAASDFTPIVLATLANPSLVYLSVIWAQNDVLLCDLVLTSFVAGAGRRPLLGGLAFTLAVLLKPQALFALPVMVGLLAVQRRPWFGVLGAALALVLLLPPVAVHGGFSAGWRWLFALYLQGSREFAFASLTAGTLPSIIAGLPADQFAPDTSPGPFGMTVRAFGTVCAVLAFVALTAAALIERAKLRTPLGLWYLAASCLSIYWFAPDMHERYLCYGACFAIVWAFAAKRPPATLAAAVLGVALLLQMTGVYAVDLGWGATVPEVLGRFVSRTALYVTYCSLNVAGLVLLLLSRRRPGESTAGLPFHADYA